MVRYLIAMMFSFVFNTHLRYCRGDDGSVLIFGYVDVVNNSLYDAGGSLHVFQKTVPS